LSGLGASQNSPGELPCANAIFMAKSNFSKPFATPAKPAPKSSAAVPKVETHAIRETVESIVIAFVLAFLFRTFEAEAFVIPTGSMAPTLMGRHKDVVCPKCGYRYQVNASEEESEDGRQPVTDCIGGMCPSCHYVLPMRPDLPDEVPERQLAEKRWHDDHPGKSAHVPTDKELSTYVPWQSSYNGDRILVNKYLYTFDDPKRWDVVVFKFPGDAKVNYIKRLIGLPGESLRIYQGDIFSRPPGATKDEDFKIERKPPEKVLSMRQFVHDTDHDSNELDAAGWPLRWQNPPGEKELWTVDKKVSGDLVRQRYSVDATGDNTAWLRYEHLVPNYEDWQKIEKSNGDKSGRESPLFAGMDRARARRLITDSNPYDGRLDRNDTAPGSLQIDPKRQGIHWVSDLMVEADVDAQSGGSLLLDLVRGGKHFTCAINLKSGEAKLSAADLADYSKASTAFKAPGKHHVGFANFDDRLLLWVDGSLVKFDSPTEYDVAKIYGQRSDILPKTSDTDLGDLAPVGIGARNAKLTVTRLQVWRDLYYIADSWQLLRPREPITDFPRWDYSLTRLPSTPSMWPELKNRQHVDFSVNDEQLFVMGDNSAESSDARLWYGGGGRGRPGGPYMDRRLLIGKALCVYWPHSWNQIPGTPIPFPLFPNVADMRLVR
jgi:signal peptidase I